MPIDRNKGFPRPDGDSSHEDAESLAIWFWLWNELSPWGPQNPFSVLGFDVDSVCALRNNDKYLEEAITMMASLKTMIHHPEENGNARKVRKINQAALTLLNNSSWRYMAICDFLARGEDPERQLVRSRETINNLKARLREHETERRARGGARKAIPEDDLNALESRLRKAGDGQVAVQGKGMYVHVYPRWPVRDGERPLYRLRYLGSANSWEPVMSPMSPEEIHAWNHEKGTGGDTDSTR